MFKVNVKYVPSIVLCTRLDTKIVVKMGLTRGNLPHAREEKTPHNHWKAVLKDIRRSAETTLVLHFPSSCTNECIENVRTISNLFIK